MALIKHLPQWINSILLGFLTEIEDGIIAFHVFTEDEYCCPRSPGVADCCRWLPRKVHLFSPLQKMSEGQSVISCLAVWVSGNPWSAHNKFENNVKSKWGEQTGSWETLICAQQRFHEECGVLPPTLPDSWTTCLGNYVKSKWRRRDRQEGGDKQVR